MELAFGVLAVGLAKPALTAAGGPPPRGLPGRLTVAVTREALEFWGEPGGTLYLSIPWWRVRNAESDRLALATHMYRIVIVYLEDDLSVPLNLEPRDRIGLKAPTPEAIDQIVETILRSARGSRP